jgi:hypothetical protein
MRRALLASLGFAFLLASCGEAVRSDGNADSADSEDNIADAVTDGTMAVRIGELGPSFKACVTDGTTRNVEPGETLPVRAAPFDGAAGTGAIAAGGRFFVCSRSLDQKWFGIVYDDQAAALPARCGVSEPAAARRDYDGPCRSGWVSSALVKLVAGLDQPPPPNQSAPLPPR